MDSVQERHETFHQGLIHTQPLTHVQLKARNKSPEAQKQRLIDQIKFHLRQRELNESKQISMTNTISDLKKLLVATNTESEEYIRQMEEQNSKLAEKAERLSAALKYSHKNGKHLQNCALFWKQYVE